eukprot:COSAG06_NODE_24366_length_665_cov_0.708481_2_plen_115_part_01
MIHPAGFRLLPTTALEAIVAPQHLFGRRGDAILRQVLGKGLTKQQFIVKCNTACNQRRGTLSARKKTTATKGKAQPQQEPAPQAGPAVAAPGPAAAATAAGSTVGGFSVPDGFMA